MHEKAIGPLLCYSDVHSRLKRGKIVWDESTKYVLLKLIEKITSGYLNLLIVKIE